MSMHGRINTDISDLFFNTDLSGAAQHDLRGEFTGYDLNILRTEAEVFLASLGRLNVAVPSRDALLEDFFDRM